MGQRYGWWRSSYLALAAALLTFAVLAGCSGHDGSEGETKYATAPTMEVALGSSPVVVTGKVTDTAKRELAVEVVSVVKGSVPERSIRVDIPKGLRAKLAPGDTYVFALAPSMSGSNRYYGMIEPYIFQLKANKTTAISNDPAAMAEFRESEMSEDEWRTRYTTNPH